MTPDQFLDRCKFVSHVGPVGVWEQIAKHGFRTAEQLILESDLNEDEQQRLLSTPRRESISLCVDGDEVLLRDQGPLFARKDLASVLGDGLAVSDWVRLLNRRTFFFTDQLSMEKLRDKYAELDGAQEVIWLSPLRVIRLEGLCLELTTQNFWGDCSSKRPAKDGRHLRTIFEFPQPKAERVNDGRWTKRPHADSSCGAVFPRRTQRSHISLAGASVRPTGPRIAGQRQVRSLASLSAGVQGPGRIRAPTSRRHEKPSQGI